MTIFDDQIIKKVKNTIFNCFLWRNCDAYGIANYIGL